MSKDAPTRWAWPVHGAMVLLIALCFLRAMIEHDPTPYWTHDPFRFAPPITGLSMGWATLYNGVLIALSGGVIVRCGPQFHTPIGLLATLGMLVVPGYLEPEHALGASAAAAFLCVLLAARGYISMYPGASKPLIAATLGFLCFQLAEGAHQYFVQHPELVRFFEDSKDTFFASRGWDPGSFQALSYERRLNQPEMLGWIQLSNVFAAMMGAGALGSGWMAAGTKGLARTALASLAVIFLGALLLSGSKGAIGVSVLACAAALAASSKRTPVSRGLCLAASGVVLMLGVLAGSFIGQLSLVFRTQYLRGAARVFTESPFSGSGPGAFQNVYQRLKPPNAPEDVTSAHNILADLPAYFGIFGLLLTAALVLAAVRAKAPGVEHEQAEQTQTPAPVLTRVLVLGPLVLVTLCLRLMADALTPDRLAVLGVGAGLWIGVSLLIVNARVSGRACSAVLFAAGSVLALHTLFDLGAVSVVSAPLFAVLIGGAINRPSTRAPLAMGTSGALAVILGALVVYNAAPLIRTEHTLTRLGEHAAEIASIHDQLERGAVSELELGAVLGAPPSATTEQLGALLRTLETERRAEIAHELMGMLPRDDARITPIVLEQGAALLRFPDAPRRVAFADRLRGLAVTLARTSDRPGDLVLAGRVLLELERAGYPPPRVEGFPTPMELWIKADALTPHDPQSAYRVMELALDRGYRPTAAEYASEAIERSERMALDPLKQLPEDRLRWARSVRGSAP